MLLITAVSQDSLDDEIVLALEYGFTDIDGLQPHPLTLEEA
jgi:hypothetical protein